MLKTKVSQALALQEAMKAEMDEIVQAATQAALLLEGSEMQKNQIQNVLNVAEESESVAVVTNFIRYQIGRSGTGRDWQHQGFGLRVIEDITQESGPIHQAIGKIVSRVAERAGEDVVTDDLRRQAHVELMRYYLGYLNRAFIFGRNEDIEGSWHQLQRAVGVKDV